MILSVRIMQACGRNDAPCLSSNKRSRTEDVVTQSVPKKKSNFVKINGLYYVREVVLATESAAGAAPVKEKEMLRLETGEEAEIRKAAWKEQKLIAKNEKLKYWKETAHSWFQVREKEKGFSRSILYSVNTNYLLGFVRYERKVVNPQAYTSCIEVYRKNLVTEKKVHLVVGMLLQLFSRPDQVVLLHSIIISPESPYRCLVGSLNSSYPSFCLFHLFFVYFAMV